MRRGDDDPVVLTAGLGTRVTAFLSPAILFALVALGYSRTGGLSALGVILLLLGVVLLLSALFDQPWRVDVGPSGITRRSALRSRHFAWSEISALTRLPKKRASRSLSRTLGGPPETAGPNSTGLMARVGTKRVLLLDRSERIDEWEVLTSAVRRWSPGCGLPPKPRVSE